MLALLVPGVGMGASDPGAGGVTQHFLPLLGVGKVWWFLVVLGGVLGALYGR